VNLPNFLTLSRIFLVPFLVVLLITRSPDWEIWGTILFLLAAATDYLDGYFARKNQQVTTLGTLLDPIADKLLISGAFISLVELALVPAWMVVIIVGREFAVSGLRNIAAAEGFTIQASRMGKTKMVSQVVAVTLVILGNRWGGLVQFLARVALFSVVVFALISMAQYFWMFWGKIDQSVKYRQFRQQRRIQLLRLRAQRRKGHVGA
jgi:CDP-diacylglycerol---glycerol-3-phosphate 3-phosphatidyltransferase